MKKLYLWLNVNRLSLNIDKTNYRIFHSYNKPLKVHITIKINNKAIKVKEYKVLGNTDGFNPQLEISDFKYALEDLSIYCDYVYIKTFFYL